MLHIIFFEVGKEVVVFILLFPIPFSFLIEYDISVDDCLPCTRILKFIAFRVHIITNEDVFLDFIIQLVMLPTRHMVSSEGVIFFIFYKLITFKLVHLYNVKHLTCTKFRSSGLQNIYKLHIWKCSTFTIFTLFTKTKHTQK